MGCGSSGEQNAKGSHPGKHRESVASECEMSPHSAMQVFSFGEHCDDNPGHTVCVNGTKADDNVQERRRTTLRRRGVSQEVVVSDANSPEAEYPFYEKTEEQTAAALQCIKTNPLFCSLLEEEREQLVGAMQVETFDAGENVLTQDEESTGKYYVIQEGEVEIYKKGALVATFEPGKGFGELELMYSPICEATVTAKTALTCLAIDRMTYRSMAMLTAQSRQKFYTDLLKKVNFLSSLSGAQFSTLADVLVRKEYEPNEKIIAGGSEGAHMHIIAEGHVKVMGMSNEGLQEVAKFGPGDTVGELEFLRSHKCVADVIAETRVVTLQLHRDHFQNCMGPLKGFLEEKAEGDQYEYYNKVGDTNDIAALFVEDFCFGDEADPGTAHVDEAPSDPPQRKPSNKESKRHGVFAENPTSGGSSFELPPEIPKTEDERQLIQTILHDHALFKNLHEDAIEMLCKVMGKKECAPTEVILKQGDTGDQLYVIATGDAQVDVDGKEICKKCKGDCVGELELMYDQPCRASVTACTDMVMYSLDRATYKFIVMKGVSERREELVTLLRAVDIFSTLGDDRFAMIADALSEAKYAPGSKLLSHGETPSHMYIILDGTVQVIGRDEAGANVDVCQFGRGSIVGQLEFLNEHATVADVVSVTDVVAGCLHRDHFERVLGSIAELLRECQGDSDFGYYREKLDCFQFGEETEKGSHGSEEQSGTMPKPVVSKRQAVSAEVDGADDDADFTPTVFEKTEQQCNIIAEVLSKNLLFSALKGNPEKQKVVVDAMERVEYAEGDHILTQDDVGGEHWYVIESGEVKVIKNDVHVCSFASGEDFGEMELMYACRTAASVVAAGVVVCWRLDRKTYRCIIQKSSQEKRELCKKALQNVSFLSSMNAWQQDHLADALHPCAFKTDECVLERESCPDCIHIIVGGAANVISADGKEICRLEYGDMIGDLEFLNQHNAVASVFSTGDLSTLKLSRDHFEICLGPVKNFLQENAMTDKYKHYQEQRAAQMQESQPA